MNRVFIGLISFVATFMIGILLVPDIAETRNNPVAKIETAASSPAANVAIPVSVKEKRFVPEFQDLPNHDEIAYPEATNNLIDVLETGAIYRESEVIAKTDEKWLTLFERNGKYSLMMSSTRVTKKRTQSYPGDEYDVQLSFDNPGVPIFAIKNLKPVNPGPVTTVYHRPSWKEIKRRNLPIDAMKTGFKREFNLNDNWYTLRVSRGLSRDGTTVGILVLEHDGISQVIAQNYYEPGYGEIIGDLLWVGDLDSDGKLDVYFDEFNEKGYFGVGLYLSSSAEPGKLVKLVATFSTAGC